MDAKEFLLISYEICSTYGTDRCQCKGCPLWGFCIRNFTKFTGREIGNAIEAVEEYKRRKTESED